jgi:hypothetical protein
MIIALSLIMFGAFIAMLVPAWIAAYENHPTLNRWGMPRKDK